MIDVSQALETKFKSTTRAIRDEALSRGWQVKVQESNYAFMRLIRPDGWAIDIFSATPPTTSHAAAIAADDKYVTTSLYLDNGLPVPETYLIPHGFDELENAHLLLSKGSVVVKPLDAGHGNGVTVGVDSEEKYLSALTEARTFSSTCIMQQQIDAAIDIRLTVINYKMAAALIRVPARVKGDGVHTIRELIEQENQSSKRGTKYKKPLNVIDLTKASAYLGSEIGTVPPADTWTQVIGTANVGSGGETIDCTDEIPAWLRELAVRAAEVSHLPVCGVDFLVTKQPDRDDTVELLNPVIIEINKCPALFIHEPATYGPTRPVTKAYVDYLATL